uniref:(northern house mosquito) hypothetical protein n=1 Tax=Culex pipiens TaxID=7175 RepID=A0A8D8GMB9_CULPI
MCWVCRKFVRTCSLFFPRKIASRSLHTDAVVQFDVRFSKLFGVYCFCAPFYRNFIFGFRTTEKVRKFSLRTVCFSLLLRVSFFLLFSRLHFRHSERRPQKIVIEVGVG